MPGSAFHPRTRHGRESARIDTPFSIVAQELVLFRAGTGLEVVANGICWSMSRPSSHRRAVVPFTSQFNKIVEVGLFFLDGKVHEVPILSVVDHGTNYQWCGYQALVHPTLS